MAFVLLAHRQHLAVVPELYVSLLVTDSLKNPKGQSLSSRDASSVLWTLSLPAEG